MNSIRGLWIAVGILMLLSAANSYFIYSLNGQVDLISQEVRVLTSPSEYSATGGNDVMESSITIAQRTIPIVAVSNEETGVMGQMNLRLIPGNNDILINTNPFSEPDVQYAIKTAVVYALSQTSESRRDMDFVFNFSSTRAELIGGESAGAAAAILTIAALEDKEIKGDSVITGTISADGNIGEIGGVLEKAKAVSLAGYRNFLIPQGQGNITYYERQVERQPTDLGFDILRSRYIPRTLDLSQAAREELGLNVVEVANINQALPYFIED